MKNITNITIGIVLVMLLAVLLSIPVVFIAKANSSQESPAVKFKDGNIVCYMPINRSGISCVKIDL